MAWARRFWVSRGTPSRPSGRGRRAGDAAHYDPVDNVVGQFCGSKRWRLWRPASGEPTGTPDYDVVVAPGDALFVPRGWWHRVDSLPCATGAVSVSLWFDDESGELPAFSNR